MWWVGSRTRAGLIRSRSQAVQSRDQLTRNYTLLKCSHAQSWQVRLRYVVVERNVQMQNMGPL